MIKIALSQFFYDRVWFGFVYFNHTPARDHHYFLFLGWKMFFIPFRVRNISPPRWYLKLFNLKYYYGKFNDD